MSWPRIFSQNQEASNGRKFLNILLKSAVSVALLIFLFNRIEIRAVYQVLSEARLDYLAWALLCYLALQLLGIYRWQILARAMGFDRFFGQYASYYFAGLFFNLFLPTTVGGDVSRCYYLAGERGRFMSALITVLADRGCGMMAMMSIASVALIFSTSVSVPSWIVIFTVGTSAFLLAGLILPFMAPALFQRKGFPIQYWERPTALFSALSLSLVIQLAVVGINYLIGEALRLTIPMGFYFVFTPLVMAVSMAPISLNGLGVREGAYVFFLLQAEVDEAKALAFALSWLILLVLMGLLGGLAWIVTPASSYRKLSA